MNGEAFYKYYDKETQKLDFILKNAYLSVSAVILCKQFLQLTSVMHRRPFEGRHLVPS